MSSVEPAAVEITDLQTVPPAVAGSSDAKSTALATEDDGAEAAPDANAADAEAGATVQIEVPPMNGVELADRLGLSSWAVPEATCPYPTALESFTKTLAAFAEEWTDVSIG